MNFLQAQQSQQQMQPSFVNDPRFTLAAMAGPAMLPQQQQTVDMSAPAVAGNGSQRRAQMMSEPISTGLGQMAGQGKPKKDVYGQKTGQLSPNKTDASTSGFGAFGTGPGAGQMYS